MNNIILLFVAGCLISFLAGTKLKSNMFAKDLVGMISSGFLGGESVAYTMLNYLGAEQFLSEIRKVLYPQYKFKYFEPKDIIISNSGSYIYSYKDGSFKENLQNAEMMAVFQYLMNGYDVGVMGSELIAGKIKKEVSEIIDKVGDINTEKPFLTPNACADNKGCTVLIPYAENIDEAVINNINKLHEKFNSITVLYIPSTFNQDMWSPEFKNIVENSVDVSDGFTSKLLERLSFEPTLTWYMKEGCMS